MDKFRYAISAILDEVPAIQAVNLRGDIETVCKQAKELGYDEIELHLHTPGRYDLDLMQRTLEKYELPVSALLNGSEFFLNGISLITDDEAKRKESIDLMLQYVDLAERFNSMLCVGVVRGQIPPGGDPEFYKKRLGEAVEIICNKAAQKNVNVILESILRYGNNYLNTVPETMDYVTSLGIDNLSLHIDFHSMSVEEVDMRKSLLYCKDKPLGYVHFTDNNRYYPGGGALDFLDLTKALLEIDYQNLIAVETSAFPTAYESAKRAIEYSKAIETAARISRLPR